MLAFVVFLLVFSGEISDKKWKWNTYKTANTTVLTNEPPTLHSIMASMIYRELY